MTKKDYDLIAGAVLLLPRVMILKKGQHARIALHMAEALGGTNHAFDPDRFIAACLGQKYTKPKPVKRHA